MDQQKVIDAIKAVDAVKFGEFELTQGGTGDYYIDKYLFGTDPNSLTAIAGVLAERVGNKKLAGVALGAVPLVIGTSIQTGNRCVIVRKESKDHSSGNIVEGVLNEGDEVVVIEDVTTTGQSALDAVEALREQGAIVNRVLVVVDREVGAEDYLADHGVELDKVLTASELLADYDEY